jgi:heterodisulfide reductase subunit A
MALLAKGYLLSEGAISEVNQDLCRGCGRCEAVCPFKAIELEIKSLELETRTLKTVKAVVNEAVCKGCGVCVVTCPVSAISIKHFPDKTIEAQFESILLKTDQIDQLDVELSQTEAP